MGGATWAMREATEDDLPAIREILAEHGTEGPILVADVVGPYLRHLLGHGRARVAVEGDLVVGFGATIDAGQAVHLADLFVRADRLGQGIGRPLLAEAFGDAEQRTTFASDDPRALPIYVRAGMRPWWASLYVEGPAARLPAPPSGLTIRDAGPEELAGIEESWRGHGRLAGWQHWAAQPAADLFDVLDGTEIVGIGDARARQASPVRVLDRFVVHPDAGVDPVPVTLAALARAGRDGIAVAAIQGPSPVLRPLLDLGFRITDRDQFLASDPGLVDPARLVPNPGLL